jgi:amino acid adenylation domain-containing protein
MKAGGAYVPLHPELPKARLADQLEETGAPVLITQSSLLGRLPEYAGHTFCLDRDAEQIACGPDTNPEPVTTSENLAYVIYTSGSTGVPKGVAIRHRNLVNYTHFLCEKVRRYDPSAYEAGLHFATVSTISADLGNTCIFPALVSGGCLHVISYEASMDSRLFAQHMTKHPIDVLKITPSNLVALLSAPEGQHILPRKLLITGGEASSWDLVERVKQMGTCKILNHYGPTETTIGSLTFPVTESSLDATESATVPIGKPIANTVVYILDGNLKPVPIGVPGEICIGGAGVAAGYLNQPQQTAERFIPNPYSPQISENLYRTGDLARFLHDGNIEFLGRIDHQLKIRGFRVEPAEIESVLRKHPGVQQGLVMAREDQPGDKRLVAYVVPALGAAPTSEALRHFLAAQLPDYMIPSAFVMLDSLPLTPNGKIDRRALPAPEQARLSGDREVVAARNPIEEKLIAIWSDVLGVEPIGVCDNFFELGGHSLLATQVIARVRSAFQIQVPLRSLFETPTIAGLAEVIAQLQSEAGIDEELDRMLAELEGLSEEEVEKLLAEETHNT